MSYSDHRYLLADNLTLLVSVCGHCGGLCILGFPHQCKWRVSPDRRTATTAATCGSCGSPVVRTERVMAASYFEPSHASHSEEQDEAGRAQMDLFHDKGRDEARIRRNETVARNVGYIQNLPSPP